MQGQWIRAGDEETAPILKKLAMSTDYRASVLSFMPEVDNTGRLVGGKIYEGNAFEEGVIHRRNELFDVGAWSQKMMLGASGKRDEADAIDPFSKTMKGALETFAKVNDLHERTGVPIHRILGAAASGNPTVPHEYELVRRVNYLTEVVGPQYVMETYNAINLVVVKPTTDLNVIGFARSAKLAGQKEIADDQIPEIAKNAYTSYFKDIYADAFRWEFGMREKKDAVIDLEAQVTQDIPGLFAKLKDDKIVAGLNAVTGTTPATDWDLLSGEHYADDAAKDIEDAENTVREYGRVRGTIMRRNVARAYRRNVNGTLLINRESISTPTSMEKNRSFVMPLNEHITGYVNDGINPGELVLVTDQWGKLFQGPTVQVTYKNVFTPAQMEGRIIFDFNGFKEVNASAGTRLRGLLS